MMRLLKIVALLVCLPLLFVQAQLPTPHAVASASAHHTGGLGTSALGPSSDGKASANLDGSVFALEDGSVWSVASGGTIGTLDKRLYLMYMSAHGKWLAFVEYNSNVVKIWTLATGEIHDLPLMTGRVRALGGSPDDSTLVIVSGSDAPELFDVASQTKVRGLLWPQDKRLRAVSISEGVVAYSPDGRLVAYADSVWTASTGENLFQVEGGFHAFSADGKTLLTQVGNKMQEWNLAARQMSSVYDLPNESSIRMMARADGRIGVLVQQNKPIQLSVWDLHAGLQLTPVDVKYDTNSYRVYFLGSSDWMLACKQHAATRLVRISTGEELATLDAHGKNWSVVRASDGSYDASPEALVNAPNQRGGMSVDGVRVDQGSFQHVPGLLKMLPGAPVAAAARLQRTKR